MNNIFIFHGMEGYPEKHWFPWMKKELEKKGCQVFVPQFPTLPNVLPKLSEWFSVLEKYEEFINDQTILIGHSLGGLFALRVLEKLDCPVRLACFVGTPIGIQPIIKIERVRDFGGFDFDWANIRNMSKDFVVFHSDNDPSVGLENGRKLAENLGVALSLIPNAGHFNAKTGYLKFPELLEKVIRTLCHPRGVH